MSEIKVGENETLESALRRFKKKCARASSSFQKLERENYYENQVLKRKLKKSEA